jgi:hypothetical protein
MAAAPERILKADRAANEIDVRDWLGGTKSAIATEEVIGLGRYGKTLTILSAPAVGHEDDGDDDDDDDEARIVESWTPRFRR